MSDNKISEIIETSLSELKNVVDVNTIIGEPINTPQGTTIIPVSKVSLAFASGGLDYGKAENPDPKKKAHKLQRRRRNRSFGNTCRIFGRRRRRKC